MGIMGAKYKAHRFVNIIFYVIVFVFGFLVGIGAKKINFNFTDIFDRLFFIDGAYAMEKNVYDINDMTNEGYVFPTPGYVISTENIYNLFTSFVEFEQLDYNFLDFPYILISTFSNSSTTFSSVYYCNNPITFSNYFAPYNSIRVHSSDTCILYDGYHFTLFTDLVPSDDVYRYANGVNTNVRTFHTDNFELPSQFTNIRIIDFSDYTNLDHNDDIFSNDSGFKEVCVNNYESFSITSNSYNTPENNEDYRLYSSRDFIWFDGYIYGLKASLYSNDEEYIPPDWYSNIYYFNSVQNINSIYNTTGLSYIFNEKGYTDKYSYYGYSAQYFAMLFNNNDGNERYSFNVFSFDNAYIENIDGTKEYPTQFCFYIRNEYDVNILSSSDIDSSSGSITILGGSNYDFTIDNSSDKSNKMYSYNNLLGNIRRFISQTFPTIHFININIYNFFLSMPELVRLFIIVFITIFSIRFILRLVVR